MPSCTVIPELRYLDVVEAIDWLLRRVRLHRALASRKPPGSTRLWRDGAVVLMEHRVVEGRSSTETPVGHAVLVRVEDADGHHRRARQRGARILRPPADYPYGERQYTAEDLAGHAWSFSQSIADVAPEQWGGVAAR